MTLIVDEVMLREPNLLIPGKKPVGNVKIDWSHSLAPKELCVIFRNVAHELVHNTILTEGTALNLITPEVRNGNEMQRFSGAETLSWYHLPHPVNYHVGGDKWSLTFHALRDPSATENDSILMGVANTNSQYIWLRSTGIRQKDTGNRDLTFTTNWTELSWITLVYNDGIDGVACYVDGVFKDAYTLSADASTIKIEDIGCGFNTLTYSFDGSIGAIYAHDFPLSANNIKSLHADPYKFLIPA